MIRFRETIGGNYYSPEFICGLDDAELAKMIRDSEEYEWELIRDIVYRAYGSQDDFDKQVDDFEDTEFDDPDIEFNEAVKIAIRAAEILGVDVGIL